MWMYIYIYICRFIYIYIYIYISLPTSVMIDTNLHIIQYKLLHNIVYLNKKYSMNFQKRYPQIALFA